MNLLIVEWISGGGYSNQKLSSNILSEGYGMLRTLISDCKGAGHNVTTFLDTRLTAFNPPNKADKIIGVSSLDSFNKKLTEVSSRVDAIYVIAPESGQVLEKIVETVEKSGGTSLNCKVEAIKRVSNKMTTHETLKRLGVQVPETVLVELNEKTNTLRRLTKELCYPLIFKPLDGVSCDGLSVVKTENDVSAAVKKLAQASTSKEFIVQKQVKGNDASTCVFSDGNKAVSVTLNQQFVRLSAPEEESGYAGGIVPFEHALENEALKVAEKAVEAVGGLRGYVGVDMVLTDKGPVVMEINPRLTVSYIGLRKVVNFNPAQALIDAVILGKLPKKVQKMGYTFFSKVEVPLGSQSITKTYNMKNVVSPPFPIEKNRPSWALVATDSNIRRGAQLAFYRTKNQLQNLSNTGD